MDIIFADDAFQHRKLSRNLDIVILDCLAEKSEYHPIPMGRARESLESLNRADFVIFNRKNLADKKLVSDLESELKNLNFNMNNCIGCDYHVKFLSKIDGSERSRVIDDEKILLVSGVGTPKSVELVLPNLNIVEHSVYPDHHRYDSVDVQEILTLAQKNSVDKILVTQKDAIKLQSFKQLSQKVWVMDLEPTLSPSVQRLHEAVAALVR